MTMRAGKAVVELELDDDKLDKGLQSTKQKAEGFGGTLKGALSAGAGFAAAEAGMAGLSGGFDLLIGNAAGFEKSLGAVKAATGASAEEMAQMRELSLQLGADTSKSASEAVLAMGELAKAGMPVETILANGAKAAVNFSEATGIGVPEAAVLVSNALNTFQADGLRASQAAEVFAKAANASAIDVTDLGMSLGAVGPVASASGVSMEEFATVMGLFGNNAIKGSDAGTSFKAFLAGLTPVSDKATKAMKDMGFSAFNADGTFKDMRTIVAELSASMADMTEEQKAVTGELLFGSDGVRAMNILLKEGTDGWDGFGAAMAEAPSLADQAATRMQGLAGQWDAFMGSVETVSIQLGTLLLPALTSLLVILAQLVNAAPLDTIAAGFQVLGEAISWFTGSEELMAGFAAALMVKVIPAVIATTAAIAAKTVALYAQVAAWIAVNAASLGWMAVIALVVAAIVYAIKHWDEIKAVMMAVADAIVGEITASWEHLKEVISGAITWVLDFVKDHWQTILAIIGGPLVALVILVIKHWDEIKAAISGALEAILGAVETAWQAITDAVSAAAAAVAALVEGMIMVVVNAFTGWVAAMRSAGESILQAVEEPWQFLTQRLPATVEGIISSIVNAFLGLPGRLLDIGRDTVQGLVDGLTSIDVGSIAGGIANKLTGGLAGKLGIGSPSKVWRALGDDTMAGLLIGLRSNERALGREMGVIAGLLELPAWPALALQGPEAWSPMRPPLVGSDDVATRPEGAGGIQVMMPDATIYARDRVDAERSMGDVAWGLGTAARARGMTV